MAFVPAPPRLRNPHDDDALLQEYIHRTVPADVAQEWAEPLHRLGDIASELPPRPTALRLTAEHGLVAAAYDGRYTQHDRPFQFIKNYLIQPSLDGFAHLLSTTDGAIRAVLDAEHRGLIDRAVPRWTSRQVDQLWTCDQWPDDPSASDPLNEPVEARSDHADRTNPTDSVDGVEETNQAHQAIDHVGNGYRLYGYVTAGLVSGFDVDAAHRRTALVTAQLRSAGARRESGLFYVERSPPPHDDRSILVERWLDRCGSDNVPAAILKLDGCRATAVGNVNRNNLGVGLRRITQIWMSVAAAWNARRGLVLMRDRMERSVADEDGPQTGALDRMATAAAEAEAVFHLAFRMVELLGRLEHRLTTPHEEAFLHGAIPIAKLTTSRQAVQIASMVVDAVGAFGHAEAGLVPSLVREAYRLAADAGTVDALSVDVLDALRTPDVGAAMAREIRSVSAEANDPRLEHCVALVHRAVERIQTWLVSVAGDALAARAGANRCAMTIGRTLQLAYLCRHAQWCLNTGRTRRALATARRFAAHGVDDIEAVDMADVMRLVEEPSP